MAKQEQHDIREYFIHSHILDVGAGVTTWYFGVPQAGYLARAIFVSTVAQITADALLTFAIATVDLGQTLTIPSASGAIGRSHTVDFSRVVGAFVQEPEDTDLIAAGAVIAVDTDGGGTGAGQLIMVIRP